MNKQPPPFFYQSPKKNESFQSWFVRNSLSYYQQPKELISSINQNNSSAEYDFDLFFNNRVYNFFELKGLNRDQLDLLHRFKLKHLIFIKLFSRHSGLVVPTGTIHQETKNPSRFCPKCLKETHYYQLHWRFNKVKFCLSCKTPLENKCRNCLTGIHIMRIPVFYSEHKCNIISCHYCGLEVI